MCFRNLAMVFEGAVIAGSQFYLSLSAIHTISASGYLSIFLFDYYYFGVTINFKQIVGIIIGVVGLLATVNGDIIISYFNP